MTTNQYNKPMPTTLLSRRYLRFLPLLLLFGLSTTASRAGDSIPFRSSGEIVLDSVSIEANGALLLVGHDTGTGTLLGDYTSTYEVWATPTGTQAGDFVWEYAGVFTITTANGDTLTASLTAVAPAGARELEAQATVIGGTGRLANLQGSWTSRARVTPTGFVYESRGTLSRPGRRAAR